MFSQANACLEVHSAAIHRTKNLLYLIVTPIHQSYAEKNPSVLKSVLQANINCTSIILLFTKRGMHYLLQMTLQQ